MLEKVGKIAGKIWKYLNEHDEVTPTQLTKKFAAPNRLVFMALGWLAREDKIDIREEGRVSYISLKEE